MHCIWKDCKEVQTSTSKIQRLTGFSKWSLYKTMDKSLMTKIRPEKRQRLDIDVERLIIDFYNRDNNSRAQPGKVDAKTIATRWKGKTRALIDYFKNLLEKFESENPSAIVSLTTFQRYCRKNILVTSFISRNSCQCITIQHQNMALKIQTLRK